MLSSPLPIGLPPPHAAPILTSNRRGSLPPLRRPLPLPAPRRPAQILDAEPPLILHGAPLPYPPHRPLPDPAARRRATSGSPDPSHVRLPSSIPLFVLIHAAAAPSPRSSHPHHAFPSVLPHRRRPSPCNASPPTMTATTVARSGAPVCAAFVCDPWHPSLLPPSIMGREGTPLPPSFAIRGTCLNASTTDILCPPSATSECKIPATDLPRAARGEQRSARIPAET